MLVFPLNFHVRKNFPQDPREWNIVPPFMVSFLWKISMYHLNPEESFHILKIYIYIYRDHSFPVEFIWVTNLYQPRSDRISNFGILEWSWCLGVLAKVMVVLRVPVQCLHPSGQISSI